MAEPEGGSTREGVPVWGTGCVLRGLSPGAEERFQALALFGVNGVVLGEWVRKGVTGQTRPLCGSDGHGLSIC